MNFEERQKESEAMAAQAQKLLKYGVFAVFGFGALMFAAKAFR